MPRKAFARAAPGLAGVGRALLEQFRVRLAFLATVRVDGAPATSPGLLGPLEDITDVVAEVRG